MKAQRYNIRNQFFEIRMWPVTAIMFLGVFLAACGGGGLASQPPPPPGSWLVLLCKAADASQEPQPKNFYGATFSKDQRDLLFDYFDIVSNHTLDVSATEVYGWFPMVASTAEIAPNVRNNSMPVTRAQTASDCKNAAFGGFLKMGLSVDPANYVGVITVINVPVDAGATGQSVVLSSHMETEIGFVAHEMLHVLGLGHSWLASQDSSSNHVWKHGGDAEYRDCWDMMSYNTCVYKFQTARGLQGTELQGAYRKKLGWLPADRNLVIDTYGPRITNTSLAAVSNPSQVGPLLVEIEITNGYYVVEYREKSGFDRGIPYNAVVIREQWNTLAGTTYLVQRQGGRIDWLEGDTFTDNDNHISIAVDKIVSGVGAIITINRAFTSTPPQLGEWCGNLYQGGEVLSCPAGAECRITTNGETDSIDMFCQ